MNSINDIKDNILLNNKDIEIILINGSFALNNMHKYSDIDIEVITKRKPKQELEFTTIIHEGKKRLVTIFYSQLKKILSSLEDPEQWSIFQNYKRVKVLYDKNNIIKVIKDKIRKTKPKRNNYFERFDVRFLVIFEYLAKAKSAYDIKDDINLIFGCRKVAFFSSLCLKPFNEIKEIKSEREFYPSLLELKNKPLKYDKNFKICYALDFDNYSREKLYLAVHELVNDIYYFMKEKKIWKNVPVLKKVFKDDYFLKLTEY
jgi:predicted nucleotidyltransferase